MYINGHKYEKCLIQKDDFYGCRHEHDIIVIPENNAIKTVQHFPVFRALQEFISCIVFWNYKRKIGWGVKKQIWIISQL